MKNIDHCDCAEPLPPACVWDTRNEGAEGEQRAHVLMEQDTARAEKKSPEFGNLFLEQQGTHPERVTAASRGNDVLHVWRAHGNAS